MKALRLSLPWLASGRAATGVPRAGRLTLFRDGPARAGALRDLRVDGYRSCVAELDAGHVPNQERPEKVLRHMREFLE